MTEKIVVTHYQMRNSEGIGLGRRYWIKSEPPLSEEELEKGLLTLISFAFGYNDYPESEGVVVGHVYFSPFSGSDSIVVSHGLYIKPEFRGSAYSSIFQELRAKLAWRLGYSRMMAVINMSNIPQVISAAKHGWTFVKTFEERRTKHLLCVIEKGIPDRADWNAHPDD